MKKLFTMILLMSGMVSMAQCNLNISWTSSVNGGNITFTNTSTGVPSSPQFAWLYDGQSSSQENPTFPYNANISTVCFAIYSTDTTCEDSICGPIGSPPCALNISWQACVGSGFITFNNMSTGTPTNASFAWLYDGQSSSQEHPTFTYNPNATDVCFAIYDIDNPNCQDSICGPINDTCNTCNLNISWYSEINGGDISFFNTSTGEPFNPGYAWLYDGQASNIENPTFPYNPNATQVCFAIDDLTNNICEDSICGPINDTLSGGCNLNINWVAGINGGNITFYNLSTGMPSNPQFSWLYNGQSSSQENPTFPYDSTVSDVCFAIYNLDSVVCEDSICGPINFDSSATVTEYAELIVEVYPNPFNDQINIAVGDNNATLDIIITDLSGRIVYNQQIVGTKETIDLNSLDAGGYLIFISDPTIPDQRVVKKILKQ